MKLGKNGWKSESGILPWYLEAHGIYSLYLQMSNKNNLVNMVVQILIMLKMPKWRVT